MSKKIPVILAFILFALLVSSQVFAQGAAGGMSEKSFKYISYFFALGIAVYGGTQAQSKAAAVALDGIARNPSAADKIQTPMILGLALMESLVIFALISTFLV
ncbi:MAG: ATP synthase F0 subunit C [Bacteriovorax sp.]|jgi:F-type H+-transporting ATPase subunit c|nr:ATP synthase F0 subunit C [Bacteriovorax sp.]